MKSVLVEHEWAHPARYSGSEVFRGCLEGLPGWPGQVYELHSTNTVTHPFGHLPLPVLYAKVSSRRGGTLL